MNRPDWTRRSVETAAAAFRRAIRLPSPRARKLAYAVADFGRRGDRWLSTSVERVFGFAEGRLGPLTLLVLAAFGVLAYVFRDWLQTGPEGPESGSTTLRNLSLVVAALIALPLAVWRRTPPG